MRLPGIWLAIYHMFNESVIAGGIKYLSAFHFVRFVLPSQKTAKLLSKCIRQ